MSPATPPQQAPSDDSVDFVAVAYTEEGSWQVTALPPSVGRDLELLLDSVRRHPADGWLLGMVSVDDDFFVMVRLASAAETADVRCLLSDVTAATDWPLARQVIDHLELPVPDDDDPAQPGGDLGIVADLGMPAIDVGVLCDDPELYPDEMLLRIAERLGFSSAFRRVIADSAGRTG